MFDGLRSEIAEIKTNKFHLIDVTGSDRRNAAVSETIPASPPSYQEFRRQFGNAKLYRATDLDYYHINLAVKPERYTSPNEEVYYRFAWHSNAYYYFRESLLKEGFESPVFCGTKKSLLKFSADFEEWLKKACATSRKKYSAKEWRRILEGPSPFTERELEVIESRKKFRWQLMGISDAGNLRLRVHNYSGIILPYLTLGVRTKDRKIDGGLWLDISGLVPGDEIIVERDCYKELADPGDIEIFDMPDPGPEDRSRYWEFRE